MATVKSTPFAVAQHGTGGVISIVQERGPILQARPIRTPRSRCFYTDPINGDERAATVRKHHAPALWSGSGAAASFVLSSVEEEGAVARHLSTCCGPSPPSS